MCWCSNNMAIRARGFGRSLEQILNAPVRIYIRTLPASLTLRYIRSINMESDKTTTGKYSPPRRARSEEDDISLGKNVSHRNCDTQNFEQTPSRRNLTARLVRSCAREITRTASRCIIYLHKLRKRIRKSENRGRVFVNRDILHNIVRTVATVDLVNAC